MRDFSRPSRVPPSNSLSVVLRPHLRVHLGTVRDEAVTLGVVPDQQVVCQGRLAQHTIPISILTSVESVNDLTAGRSRSSSAKVHD